MEEKFDKKLDKVKELYYKHPNYIRNRLNSIINKYDEEKRNEIIRTKIISIICLLQIGIVFEFICFLILDSYLFEYITLNLSGVGFIVFVLALLFFRKVSRFEFFGFIGFVGFDLMLMPAQIKFIYFNMDKLSIALIMYFVIMTIILILFVFKCIDYKLNEYSVSETKQIKTIVVLISILIIMIDFLPIIIK